MHVREGSVVLQPASIRGESFNIGKQIRSLISPEMTREISPRRIAGAGKLCEQIFNRTMGLRQV
jgi:hypothetical protein